MNASCETTRLPGRDTRRDDRSQNNRIRKLLLSEYCELSETILAESPFAETTRNGRGLRQVALGLTPTRLIVAADVLQTNPGFFCPPGIDASIESFELVSLYPLECVQLSVFGRRRRRTLKARFVNGRANYYELGGEKRRLHWKIWCEQVQRLLARKVNGSSLSETTAASSSSSSALYLLSSEIEVGDNCDARRTRPIFRIWTRYGGAGDYVTPTWTEKDLYLGPAYNELVNGHYTPVPIRFAGASLEDLKYELKEYTSHRVICEKSCRSWPCQKFGTRARSQRANGLCNVLFVRSHKARRCEHIASCKSSPCNVCELDDTVGIEKHCRCHSKISWIRTKRQFFSEKGISRNECNSYLIMNTNRNISNRPGHPSSPPEEDFREHTEGKYGRNAQQQRRKGPLTSKVSRFGLGVPEKCHSGLILGPYRGDHVEISKVDERNITDSPELVESGVTVWEGGCESSKNRRHPRRYAFASAAHFLHALGPWSVQPGERDSVQTLRSSSAVNIRKHPSDPELRLPFSRRHLTASVSCAALTTGAVGRGRVTLFWTPEYWYRPQAAAAVYRELRKHLTSLQDFRRGKEKRTRRRFFGRRGGQSEAGNSETTIVMGKSSGLLERVLSINGARKRGKGTRENIDRCTTQLRKLLRMNFRITVWDLDSGTLATQLTMIDRDLFARIPATEIEVLTYQRSSHNAPNLGAWIAFSHRIACLTVSEILAIKKLDMRTRIMARFINAAEKCFVLGNFQSCRSILAGLQAPPIHRLRRSWAYLRTRHASRYESMEKLSKIYKSPRCLKYQRAWAAAERRPPSMPYVGHFLAKVLEINQSLREVKGNFASLTGKRSTVRIACDSPLSVDNNNAADLPSRDKENPTGLKQCLARRFLTATLARIQFTTRKDIVNKTENNARALRQRYLERKYFHRWCIVASKAHREKEGRSTKSADSTRKRILDVSIWLIDCQRSAQTYNFPLHSYAHEFLLKARYREDRENFFISFKLEPPNGNLNET
ncbi:PREDICTED: uncharacterized protein LOC106745564 [Dinoponera quadriceps]|uniref:Uncharacterized protein LOC106745564 n=1 Tax=Dinoponera quadriceps TaxID=609295 RepID=A0A6P3XE53_DINQU|nr:PREDICTED: uncharacterized protein LOC106745564 [Dinoponera quadriceps]